MSEYQRGVLDVFASTPPAPATITDQLHTVLPDMFDLAARILNPYSPTTPDDVLRLAALVSDWGLEIARVTTHDRCHGGYGCRRCEGHECQDGVL